jgi:hypothetical protein
MFPERFDKFIQRTDECWIWTGSVSARYGEFVWKGKNKRASRLAWEFANETSIPPGLCVLHRCDNPVCVRPSHLFLGTHAENMKDMKQKGRARSVPRKAACLRGHPMTPENVRVSRNGSRCCLTCYQVSKQRSQARRRAEMRAAKQALLESPARDSEPEADRG